MVKICEVAKANCAMYKLLKCCCVRLQTFKRLLKEDSVDYSAFATTVSKKRGRQIHAETVHGSNHGDSHPPPRTLRRKGALSRRTVDCDTDFEPEDDDDGDWTKRQKAGVSKGKGRAKKSAAP